MAGGEPLSRSLVSASFLCHDRIRLSLRCEWPEPSGQSPPKTVARNTNCSPSTKAATAGFLVIGERSWLAIRQTIQLNRCWTVLHTSWSVRRGAECPRLYLPRSSLNTVGSAAPRPPSTTLPSARSARTTQMGRPAKFRIGDLARLGGINARPLPADYWWARRGRIVRIAATYQNAGYFGRGHVEYLIRGRRGRPDLLLPSYHLRRIEDRDRARPGDS